MLFQLHYVLSVMLMPLVGTHETDKVFSIKSGRQFVQAGQTLPLQVEHRQPGFEYSWSATDGYFTNYTGAAVDFRAPVAPGKAIVTCQLLKRGKVKSIAQMEITVFSRVVVLKADDLVLDSTHVFPPMWNKFFDFIDSLKIDASAGIITASLENAPAAYYNKIKSIVARGNVEFWNHGYNHAIHVKDKDGIISHEFQKAEYTLQKAHLARAQELGKQHLGIIFKTFGAPGNFHDENTLRLIDESNEIKIWLYGNPKSAKTILPRIAGCDVEYPVHYPDFQKFVAAYHYVSDPAVTLQFHPTRWDEMRFDEFRRIVFYLKDVGALFLTPTGYAQAFHPEVLSDSVGVILCMTVQMFLALTCSTLYECSVS